MSLISLSHSTVKGEPLRLPVFRNVIILICGVLGLTATSALAQSDGTKVKAVWVDIANTVVPEPRGIADLYVDKAGNVYTLGYLAYGDYEDPNIGTKYHVVLKKYDGLGQVQWYDNRFEFMGYAGFYGELTGDANGNIYASADHGRSLEYWTVGEGTLVFSFTPTGGLRWSDVYWGPVGNDRWNYPSIALGENNRVRVVSTGPEPESDLRLLIYDSLGNGPNVMTFGNPVETDPDNWVSYFGRFLLRVNSRGGVFLYGFKNQKAWAVRLPPEGSVLGEVAMDPGKVLDVSLDSQGNSYCLNLRYDSTSLIKLDSTLAFKWRVDFNEGASPSRVLVDPGGDITVFSAPEQGGAVGIAAKYRPDGSLIFEKSWPTTYWRPMAIAGDRAGNLYVLDVNGILQSFDPDGNSRWQTNISPSRPVAGLYNMLTNSHPNRLRVDDYGDVYVSAHVWFSDDPYFDYETQPTVVARFTQQKTFLIRDVHGDFMPNKTFNLIRVHNDPPTFDEDTLGMFTTSSRGQFVFPFAGTDGYEFAQSVENPVADTLRIGDTLKVALVAYSEPSVRHASTLGSKYSICLDNGSFLTDGRLVFDTVKYGSLQEITLRHTEYRYNLLVSVEWDAEVLYLLGLEKDFRQMSNYLYDVSDGQVRLDTVAILDDRSGWDQADIRIKASNVYWPNSGIMGIAWPGFPPIVMPRKWFGDADSCRIFSHLLHPLMDELSDNYRTMGHEFGHYGLGFSDEYLFVDAAGNPLPDGSRCSPLPQGNYGFMDHQYDRPSDFGVRSSEMSSEYRYQSGSCQNTEQWYDNSRSCWDDFEHWAEGSLNGTYVPILKPSVTDSTERLTPPGLDYFPGPNDDLYNLDYDVGRLVRFPTAVVAPDPGILSVHLKVDTVVSGGLNVQLLRRGASPMYQIDEGTTTDRGQLWVYGMDFARDEILVAGSSRTYSIRKKSTKPMAEARKTWLCGSIRPGSGASRTDSRASASATGDSVELSLRPVVGQYPMVCDGQLSGNGWTYSLWFDRALNQNPQLDIITDRGEFLTSVFTAGANNYGSQVANHLTVPGKATIWAVDDSSNTFFLSTPFEVMDITSPKQLAKLIGPEGEAVLKIDGSNSGVQRVMILSSAYPPLLNGLGPGTVQGGWTHSLSTYPNNTLVGSNSISVSYSNSDFVDGDGAIAGDESALRVFRWNTGALRWELVGGYVNTEMNTVTASITEAGVYGAFTAGCCVGKVGDINGDGNPEPTLGDIALLIDAKFISYSCESIPCLAEADINQSGGFTPSCSDLSIGDISTLVDYLFITGPDNMTLPDCL